MTGAFRSLRTVRRVPPRSRFELEMLEPREVPATITVTNLSSLVQTGDGVSIREALDSINAGSNVNSDVAASGTYGTSDTILFAAGLTGTINISTQLAITQPVTVTGPGAGALAIVNTAAASATSRVLLVDPATAGSTVTISGLRFSGGNSTAAGGGILNQDAILRLNGVEVTNNITTGKGGGISLPSSSAQLFLTDSGVRNNTASSDGGGVNLDTASPVTLLRSTISGNTCGDDGGALYFFSGGSLTMDNSTISGNTCPAGTGNDGGAMYLWSVTATIRNSTIANNTAGRGGAICINSGSSATPLTISNSTISGNNGTSTSTTNAGGIARTTATAIPISITSSIIAGNLGGASVDLRDMNINGNTGVTGSNNLIGIKPAGLTITGSANLLGNATTPLNAQLGPLASNGGNTQTMALLAASPAINAGSGTGADQRGIPPVGQKDIGAYEFAPTPSPPTFTSATTVTFLAGSFNTFTITTAGFPLPAITRSGVLPSGVSFTDLGNGTARISGTPALGTGGFYNLVFTAANGQPPDATQNFTLRVNQRPAITSLNNATFIAGTPGTAVVTTTGFPAPAIVATSPLPNGIALVDNGDGTANITGTALVAGSYTFNLSAGNGVLPDASQSFTLRVVLPPTFVSGNSATFTAGTAGSFTVTAIGSPLPRLSHSSGTLPAGVTFMDNGNGIGTLAGIPTEVGAFTVVFSATNGVDPDARQDFTVIVLPPASPPTVPPPPPASPPPPPPPGGGGGPLVPPPPPLPISVRPSQLLVATPGSVAAGTEVRLINPNNQEVLRRFVPFPGFQGEISTALDDMNGDGINDYAVAAGAGGGPHVKVFDGSTGAEIQSFFAFDSGFLGGVNLASGDVDGDGLADLVVAAGPGGGPHVKAFAGGSFVEIRSFYAYAADFGGGVNVSSGDLDGDGDAEIITAARSGGGPHVKAFDGRTLAEVQSFFAYDAAFTGGVNVAAGDLDGDGRAEIITAPGAGGGPHVKAFDGQTGSEVRSFFAYDAAFNGGVSVAAGDLDGDGDAEIVTAPGAGGGPHLKGFDGRSLAETYSFFVLGDQFRGGVVLD